MVSSQAYPVNGHTHLLDVVRRPRWLQKWERKRHGRYSWLIELLAEFYGVYFYVWCGVGATLALNIGNLTAQAGVGSLLTVGLAYGFGIVFAVAICAPVAGGHFNPCVTIASAVWRGFPWKKVPTFIVAQILGAYFACMLVYMQYSVAIHLVEIALKASGKYDIIQFTPSGVAGAFALYAPPSSNIINIMTNEYLVDFFLGLVIWAILDPTNNFIPPVAAPWVVGMAYTVAIWGYAPVGISANSARDVGGRLMAMTIWGRSASGGTYAAVAALTNIPATLNAALVYEFIFTDSSRVLPRAQLERFEGHKAQLEHQEFGHSQPGRLDNGSATSTQKGPAEQVA